MRSLSGCVPAALVGAQGETGVDGGVSGLNPDVGFLSQALKIKQHMVKTPLTILEQQQHSGVATNL